MFDKLTFMLYRLPINIGNSTPAYNKIKDDDNGNIIIIIILTIFKAPVAQKHRHAYINVKWI